MAGPSGLLVALAVFAGAGGFLFGCDMGVQVATLPLVTRERNLTDSQTEAVVGHTKIGAAVGAFTGAVLFRRGHSSRGTL